MKKSVYVIILTFWVFVAGVVLSVSTVYRVGHVSVTASTVTQEAKADIHTALICTLSRGEAAWQTLPFGDSVTVRHLIENILYEGLPRRVAYLVGGEKYPTRKKPRPYDGPLP